MVMPWLRGIQGWPMGSHYKIPVMNKLLTKQLPGIWAITGVQQGICISWYQWIMATNAEWVSASCRHHLTHWGRVTHVCVAKLIIIGSDNGLSPDRRQTIIWTNAGLLSIGPLRRYFSENLIKMQQFSLRKIYLKMSSAKWRPSCLGLNVLILAFQGDLVHSRRQCLIYVPMADHFASHSLLWLPKDRQCRGHVRNVTSVSGGHHLQSEPLQVNVHLLRVQHSWTSSSSKTVSWNRNTYRITYFFCMGGVIHWKQSWH